MKLFTRLSFAIALIGLLQSCSEKQIDISTPPLADYFPLTVGKYITYRLDSTVLTQFGADTAVHSYKVKDLVDAEIADNTGRKAYRVFRSITDTGAIAPFIPNNTFTVTPEGTDWIEYVENNLRFMKLRFPLMNDFQWKGNSFIDASSISSSVRYLYDWDYTYQNIGQPFTVNGRTFDNTITVLQRNEEFPEGDFDPSQPYKQWDYSIEVYAKGVGLIYKNFDHKVWQGPTPAPDAKPGYWEDGSYRVVLQVLDYN